MPKKTQKRPSPKNSAVKARTKKSPKKTVKAKAAKKLVRKAKSRKTMHGLLGHAAAIKEAKASISRKYPSLRKFVAGVPLSAPVATTIVHTVDINALVNRFLLWRLPEDFSPDGGISFAIAPRLMQHWPTGTNLFTADQARKMFEYCVTGLAIAVRNAGKALDEATADDKQLVARVCGPLYDTHDPTEALTAKNLVAAALDEHPLPAVESERPKSFMGRLASHIREELGDHHLAEEAGR